VKIYSHHYNIAPHCQGAAAQVGGPKAKPYEAREKKEEERMAIFGHSGPLLQIFRRGPRTSAAKTNKSLGLSSISGQHLVDRGRPPGPMWERW